MTPRETNVIVVDESGNEYGATWPKRARGLVKSGRARFIDENRICLACPPNINEITEDIKMSENKKIEAAEAVENTEIAEATENTATKYTIDYVLEQIAKLHADKEFYSAITNEFKSVMAVNSDSFAAAESAQAIGKAIMCRETTNQQLIAFYEKMYDDLKPKAPEPMDPVLKTLTDILKFDGSIIRADYREKIMKQVVAYAEQLKATAMQPSPEETQDKQEKINLLLAHLSECVNDSAACYMADELRRLMEGN